jgi:hypothetical protein
LSRRTKTVSDYLKEVRESRKDKPEQIREALGIYVELWERVVERGVVFEDDDIDTALSKVEAKGGLYRAASAQPPE